MSVIDVNKIINGTPKKRLLNSYDKMKENYSMESAKEYLNEYSDMPLPFILENSRYIFSEPFFGFEFYKDIITDKNSCLFLSYESELEKVSSYLEEYSDNMSIEQREMYESLRNDISDILVHTKNARINASYISERVSSNFEDELSSALYDFKRGKCNKDSLINLFNESTNPIAYFLYAPSVMSVVDDYALSESAKAIIESLSIDQSIDEDKWRKFTEVCQSMNLLKNDRQYVENVNTIPNRSDRMIYEYFMNENIASLLNDRDTIMVKESECIYESPNLAVNSLFDDIEFMDYESSINEEKRISHDIFEAIALETSLDFMTFEYRTTSDLSNTLSGYSMLEGEYSVEDGYKTLLEKFSDNPVTKMYSEAAEDEDVSDEDIDSIDSDEGDSGKK